jgi:1-acyl-sn-glycerol-3-phosphate acyltransferase
MRDRYHFQETRAFAEQLRVMLAYHTSGGGRWRFGPLRGLRAACFHLRILGVYLVARRMIRQGIFDLDAYATRSWRCLKVTEDAGGQVRVSGLAPLAATPGPVVIVGNHMSSLETLLLPGLILPFKDVAFVVKRSLLHHAVFGPIMRSVKHIAVGRDNPREDLKTVLEEGAALLRRGVTVVIFPQATRAVEFDPEAFNTLGVKLAARAGVPVIPLALKTDFMANGRWLKDVGPVVPGRAIHFEFGTALPSIGNGKAAHDAVVAFVKDRLRAWGGTVKEGSPS